MSASEMADLQRAVEDRDAMLRLLRAELESTIKERGRLRDEVHALRQGILRAGADESGDMGEDVTPEEMGNPDWYRRRGISGA